MKKKTITILSAVFIAIFLAACSSDGSSEQSSTSTEYEIDEFGALYEKTNSLFEDEAEYLTAEELNGDKGYEIYERCSNETGLPFNTEITLRGKKAGSLSNFCVETVDGKYSVLCFLKESEPDISLFIKNGESIVVNGIFSESPESYGCLTNATIISPKEIDTSYNNNIAKILDDYNEINGSVTIQGEVDTIMTLEEFEYFATLYDAINYEHQDYYYDTVVSLKGGDGVIYFMYDNGALGDLKVGDKIATQGYIYSLMDLKNADGTTSVLWGFLGNIYEIYKFN